ncbi:MAG: sigma-70 family RNA polymerase sigma factor [Chitinophagaceae bacterium]|nr:sigma-70 family RNA polymerase sigma factor [Chitinophagaceae bacterium]
MEESNDDLLLNELRAGSDKAFTIIYKKYWRKIYVQAHDRLKDPKQSQDITQEIFISLWERREQHEIQHLYAWLSAAVKYKVFKLVEAQKVKDDFYTLDEKLLPVSNPADHQIITQELMIAFNSFLEKMPPQRKKIFQLRFEKALNTKAIALQLNINQKTVQNQLLHSSNDIRSILLSDLIFIGFILTGF